MLVENYHDRGLSTAEIAEETGHSKGYVWERLDAAGIDTRRVGGQSTFHDIDDELPAYLDWLAPKQQADMRAVAIEGRPILERARRRGVTRAAVREKPRIRPRPARSDRSRAA